MISTKTSKSPEKSRKVQRSPGKFREMDFGNKVRIKNTFKNTPEYELDTFCDIISHLIAKYRPDFLGISKIVGPDRTSPDFDAY